MKTPVPSTIAQVLFETTETPNFAHIVAELEEVLVRHKADLLETAWDCNDLVFFDLDETRLALAYAEFPDEPVQACLTISVGPRWEAQHIEDDPGFDVLCSRIVERLQSRYMPLAVLWNQTDEEVSADLLDALTDALPMPSALLPPIDALIDPLLQTADDAEAARAPIHSVRHTERPQEETLTRLARPKSPPHRLNRAGTAGTGEREIPTGAAAPPANDIPAITAARSPDLSALHQALGSDAAETGEAEQKLSTQMRLAVHAMNATLIVVWLPLGAAAMTYSLLKGEDIKFSGRMMAVTGALLAFAQSPLTHTVVAAAVAGTLH